MIADLDTQGTSLVLEWKNTALPGYETLDEYRLYEGTEDEIDIPLVDGFEDQTFYRASEEDLFTAEEDYAFFLSKYNVKLNPTGLNQEAIQEYMDGIRVTRMDVVEGGEVDYHGFEVIKEGNEIFIDFLYTTYVDGDEAQPAIPDKALEPGENFLVKVMMINHRVEEAPKTGDDIMIAGSVMTFSAAALVVLLMLKKKKR